MRALMAAQIFSGYGGDAGPLLREIIARTPAVMGKVRAELPAGFSEQRADRMLDGLWASAMALEAMPPE
ncbi:hypothetical protein OVY01_02695 [Robbsia sp. Bb-Pol-6]|uniref:TetR family transcriptional regulator n=1 Tax=Robbsia betulipollinis TaxID=2981849 RepID=A0ABT3ZI12_9BURK|nr:hypothetical protein [Robbsia betulipollinis]MCY0386173.1 hypothetical protein [Robbsia betulipollinis]